MQFLNYIPCKSKSHRIPGKNLKKYGNLRLLDYTVNFSRATKKPSVLSTDIAELQHDYADLHFYKRSTEAADFEKTNLEVISFFLEQTTICFEYLVLLQVTHPIRSLKIYHEIIEYISNTRPVIPVITITDKSLHLERLKYLGNKTVHGSIYVFPKKYLSCTKNITDFIGFYCADPDINIDNPSDEKLFEEYLQAVKL